MARKFSFRSGFTIAALFVIAVFPNSAFAASDKIPDKLSVVDAVSVALEYNADLKQAENSQLDSVSRLRKAALNTSYGVGSISALEHTPGDNGVSTRVFGSMTYENLLGTEAEIAVSPFGIGSQRGSIAMTLRHPLMKGRGLLSPKSDMVLGARSDASIQNKEFYILRQSKIQDVVESYYRAVLASEQIKVRQKAMEVAEDAATGATKRADAGLVAGIEVSRAEVRVAETKNQLNLQKQIAKGALDRLMIVIGVGVGQTPELTDSVPEGDIQVPGLSEAIKTALENRAELFRYDERIAEQARKLAMAEDELRPELNAVASFNSTNNKEGFLSGSLYELGAFNMGVELRLPLDKRIIVEDRDIAQRGTEVLKNLRVYQMEQVAEQVRSAYRSVESARSTVEIFSQNKQIAEDRLQIAQRMVDEGLETNREVLEAQESLTQLENSLLAARTDLYLAGINLKYAMGEDLSTMVTK